jgi:hypothetical protein
MRREERLYLSRNGSCAYCFFRKKEVGLIDLVIMCSTQDFKSVHTASMWQLGDGDRPSHSKVCEDTQAHARTHAYTSNVCHLQRWVSLLTPPWPDRLSHRVKCLGYVTKIGVLNICPSILIHSSTIYLPTYQSINQSTYLSIHNKSANLI